MHRRSEWRATLAGRAAAVVLLMLTIGCAQMNDLSDRQIEEIIALRQRSALQTETPTRISRRGTPLPMPSAAAYEAVPIVSDSRIPPGFQPESRPASPGPTAAPNDTGTSVATPRAEEGAGLTSAPAALNGISPTTAAALDPSASQPARFRERVFTLTDALAYAQRHRREYQSQKEDLFLATLSLTLERHLWTPQFQASFLTVYGNYGEIRDFDQAMRFVANLAASQRLPWGGELTAAMVNTLIRDVKKTITASETGQISLGLRVPLLRGAGPYVAREELIQLERELTYAVRDFERFRRQQLVSVASTYFSLLGAKQQALDAVTSVQRAYDDLLRAQALQSADESTLLDTGRAEQRFLTERNRLAVARESFRAAADRFKIFIGMSVDEPLGIDDLESIAEIEQQIAAGAYPLLVSPPAADDERRAVEVAIGERLDLLTLRERVEDSRRGVALARNSLLPDLDWNSSLLYDTPAERYNSVAFEQDRATWRSELLLSMNDRFADRTRLRAAVIDVSRAQRSLREQEDLVRAEVRGAVNQIRLQDDLLLIQTRNLEVADKQREFAGIQYEEGLIDNRDKVDAEDAYFQALNQLNQAKTSRWSALLAFRLATDTLRVGDEGEQYSE